MPTDTSTTGPNGTTSSRSTPPLEQKASEIADHAGRAAEREASRSMDRAGDTLDQVARAVRDSGNQLRGQRPEIADVADLAADRVERASAYLREHDARDVLAEAERFARRQPALLIGGGLLVGLVAGRLLRSAEPSDVERARMAGGTGTYLRGGSTGSSSSSAASWSGGSSSDTVSTRPEGTTTPSDGYGTGYGASPDALGGSGGPTATIAGGTESGADAVSTSRRSTSRGSRTSTTGRTGTGGSRGGA